MSDVIDKKNTVTVGTQHNDSHPDQNSTLAAKRNATIISQSLCILSGVYDRHSLSYTHDLTAIK